MFLKPLLLLLVSCLSLCVPPALSSPLNHLSNCKELIFRAALSPLTSSPPSPSVLYVVSKDYSKEELSSIGPESPELVPLPCTLSYKTSELEALTSNEPGDKEMRTSYPAHLLSNKTLLFLVLSDPLTVYGVIQTLQTGNVLNYYCGHNHVETCYELKVQGETLSHKRSLEDSGTVPESHAHVPGKTWVLPVFGLIVGVVLLTVSVFMCVKSSSQNEQLLQPNSSGTLRILSGPPPEYFGPPPVPVASRPHSSTVSNPDSLSRGAAGSIKPTSPSGLSNGDKDRSFSLPSSPGHQSPRRKLATPLPEVPKQEQNSQEVLEQKPAEREPERKEEEEEEEEQEEDPYDYAKFDESVHREGIDSPSSAKSPPPPPPPPGGYAVVTRHSETTPNGPATNYTEVRQVGGASRGRSSTDPVAVPPPPPPPPSSHGPITRTYTEGGAHPPLPLPPRNIPVPDDEKDGMYDSISNLRKSKDIYDSLDNEEDNEMYESVPEDVKEEILSSSVPSRGPRYLDNTPSPSSPSPTKVPRIIATGAPDSPKGKGRRGRQRPESTSEEGEKGGHNRLSFFNRIRSSSTSAAVGGAKKETRKHDGTHSDHTHLPALPLPPEPDRLDDEDDDDTYDSVRPSLVANKSATLPVKSVGMFSSRIKEPLPEVPEDSGSGSASIVVQRDRVLDKSDPNYDTVRKEEGGEEEEGEEPDYDTVKRGGSHNYAKVTSHGEGVAPSIGHDSVGYARVDPDIIERKRTNSQTKRKEEREEEEEEEEDPYDRVKDLEPGYSSVKELKEGLSSDTPSQLEAPPTSSEAPPTSLEAPPTQSEIPDRRDSPVQDPELTYTIIDPSVVQRKRGASIGTKDKGNVSISIVPRPDSMSPAPPLPPVGDLGMDLSEFEPPPIPVQSFNDEDLLSPPEDEEDPYSKVGEAKEETVTMEIRDSVLSSESSEGGVPVYDSLEPQTPLYDSLDPTQPSLPSPSLPPPSLPHSTPSNEQQPTYDCLSSKEDT